MTEFASIDGVVHVERLAGPDADPEAPPALLVEVPHGADRRAHYDGLRAQLRGPLPEDLHCFFHVNTDVGAWQLGRRIAEDVLRSVPTASALLLRCLIPRTFIDTNRIAGPVPRRRGPVTAAMTSALPPYVRHPGDRKHLLDLHGQYVSVAERAYAWVCAAGGFAVNPHTYGPVTLPIEKVDEQIVENLRRAHQPDVLAKAPVRPKIDLIGKLQDGTDFTPEGAEEALRTGFEAIGVTLESAKTYFLHAATQGHRFAVGWPGQVLGFEVRRDLLVERWTPFEEQAIDARKVEQLAAPFAAYVAGWLASRG